MKSTIKEAEKEVISRALIEAYEMLSSIEVESACKKMRLRGYTALVRKLEKVVNKIELSND